MFFAMELQVSRVYVSLYNVWPFKPPSCPYVFARLPCATRISLNLMRQGAAA